MITPAPITVVARASAHYQDLVVKRVLPLLASRKVELLRLLDEG